MCGRYVLSSWSDVIDQLGLTLEEPDWFEARYNVAPTQIEPVLMRRAPEAPLDAAPMQWGLVPHWADDLKFGARCINARSETAHTKPSFRDAFTRRRCVVPVTGFYEWRRVGKERRPYFVHDERGLPLLFAGLWSTWRDAAAERNVETFTVLTREAEGALTEIHDRMPVCLEPQDAHHWTDPAGSERAVLAGWLAERPPGRLALRPVATTVNRVGNEGSHLLEERPDHGA